MLIQSLLLGLLGGFAMWDGRVFGQQMLERPLVTGPLVGLILGDLQTGIIVGSSIELVMMGIAGIGATTPPDVVAGGILGTAFAIMSGLSVEAAIALALPIAMLAQSLGILDRTINGVFNHWADKSAEVGDYKGVEKAYWSGAFLFFLTSFTVVFLGAFLGSTVIGGFVESIPQFVLDGLKAASGMLPALGIAILMQLIMDKSNAGFLVLGFVLAAIMGVSTTGIALIAGVIAYTIYMMKGNQPTTESVTVGSFDDCDGEL